MLFMSKRNLIVFFLGFWVIACLTWFYLISKNDDPAGKTAVTSTASREIVTASTASSTPDEIKPTAEMTDTAATGNSIANDSAIINEVIPASETVVVNYNKETESSQAEETTADANLQEQKAAATSTPGNINTAAAAAGFCYFTYNSEKITRRNFSTKLFRKISVQIKQPGSRVLLTGYSDDIGSEEYNIRLGMKRAEKIKNYLVKKGIPADAIEISSKGEADPVASNKTPRGRAKNRRVEISIIS
jgi:outer membrane protein OmpA-like peptidoglycan-associated protein